MVHARLRPPYLAVIRILADLVKLFTKILIRYRTSGSFDSSDPILNKLWAVCTRSGQVLRENAYVDCSHRERAEWMDCDPPASDTTRTALSAKGSDGQVIHDAHLLTIL